MTPSREGDVREVLVRLSADHATAAETLLAPGGTTLEAYLRELLGRWLRGEQSLPMKAVQVLDLLSNKGRRFDGGEYIEPARLEEIARRVFDAAERYPKNLRAPNGEDFRRVIVPVENGRAAHALGHFIGAIALFGFAGEMLTLLLYKIHVAAGGFDEFERLGQEARLDRIKAKIPDEWFQALSRVKARRREALHFWAQPENPERESLNALADIGRVLGGLFAHEVIEGRVAVKYEPFREYMNREWLPNSEVE